MNELHDAQWSHMAIQPWTQFGAQSLSELVLGADSMEVLVFVSE